MASKKKNERKASDVLLALEQKVNELLGYYKNLDHNIKLILQSINSQRAIQSPASEDIPTVKFPSENKSESQAKENKNLVVGEPLDEDESKQVAQEAMPQGSRRTSKFVSKEKNSTTKKIAVTQQVSFPDGDPVAFANIEITDSKGETIKRTKTNGNGTWLAPLVPGEYKVYLRKNMTEDSDRLPVEFNQNIEVPQSNRSIQLPPPELPEAYAKKQKD